MAIDEAYIGPRGNPLCAHSSGNLHTQMDYSNTILIFSSASITLFVLVLLTKENGAGQGFIYPCIILRFYLDEPPLRQHL